MPQPPLVVDPFAPAQPPPGLFSVAASFREDLPEHGYNNGVIWHPDTCQLALLNPTPCQTPPYTAFTAQALEPIAMGFPFAVYASVFTGGMGYTHVEAARRVEQRVLNSEQQLCETALWGGNSVTAFQNVQNYAGTTPGTAGGGGVAGITGGIFKQLAQVGATAGYVAPLGTSATVADAVSRLEQAAGSNYYGQAVIHARPRLAAYFGKAGLIRVIGLPRESKADNVYSQNWNAINFGNGYAGTGPAGEAVVDGTSEYLWASGAIRIWRSPKVEVSDSDILLDRTSNQRGVYAWRNYVIGVECFLTSVSLTALAP